MWALYGSSLLCSFVPPPHRPSWPRGLCAWGVPPLSYRSTRRRILQYLGCHVVQRLEVQKVGRSESRPEWQASSWHRDLEEENENRCACTVFFARSPGGSWAERGNVWAVVNSPCSLLGGGGFARGLRRCVWGLHGRGCPRCGIVCTTTPRIRGPTRAILAQVRDDARARGADDYEAPSLATGATRGGLQRGRPVLLRSSSRSSTARRCGSGTRTSAGVRLREPSA